MMKYLKKLFITSVLTASFIIPSFNVYAAQPVPMRGLDLWLEADYGITETDGYVSAWESKVKSLGGETPHILNQAGNEGSTKPVLTTSDNGRKAVYFNMASLKTTIDRYDGEITVFVVSKPKALPSAYPSYLCDVGSMFVALKNNGQYNVGTSSSGFLGGTAAVGNYSVLCTVSNYWGDYRQVYSYQNNVKIQGPFNTNGTTRTGYNAITQYKLGRYSNDEIAAVLVYKGALDIADRTRVYNYLNNKYMQRIENNSFSAAVMNKKIIVSANNLISGSVSGGDFVITQNGKNININNACISEYGTVVIESDDIAENIAADVKYIGNGLTNLYGDNIETFEIQSSAADFRLIDYHDNDYSGWSLKNGNLTNDGEALNFKRTDMLINGNPITGEQTGYAVFKINNIQENDTLFGRNLYLNSITLSSENLAADEKNIDYIEENVWYVLSYRIKETEGTYSLTLKINEEQVMNDVELASPFSIDSIGGGDFDLKSLYITDYAMNDVDFCAVERSLLNSHIQYTARINSIDYTVDETAVTATLNYDMPTEESVILITAVKDSDGRLINSKTDYINSGVNRTFTTSIDRESEIHELSMYIWAAGELQPVAEKEIFIIRDIDKALPVSTMENESSKSVPEFETSLPEEYSLSIDEYDDTAVNYLNAIGFLPEGFVYSADKYMSEEIFLNILNLAAGTDLTGKGQTITKKQALVHIYNALNVQYKAYANETYDGVPTFPANLTEDEKRAVLNALKYEIIKQSEMYSTINEKLKYNSACELLSKLVIKAELYKKDKGAVLPYTLLHSKFARYNGDNIISKSNTENSLAPDNIAFEALGKECVNLSKTGDYIEFSNVPASNKLSVCYSIPKGGEGTVSLYVNDEKKQTIEFDAASLYCASDSYNYMNYFEEKTVDVQTNSGDNIKFVIESEDIIPVSDGFSSGISINYVKAETIDEAKPQPDGYINANDFGANGKDSFDDTAALQKAINQAYKTNRGLYLPAGTYYIGKTLNIPDGVKIAGAGMWHTAISCGDTTAVKAGFRIAGNDISVEDIKISASKRTVRKGSGGAFIGKGNRILIKNVWMSKTNTGMWAELYNSVIDSCRVTDTLADGIHFPHSSQNNIIKNCIITGCGDDGIATSSSVAKGIAANNISALNNTVERIYWGRGIMYSGNCGSVIDGNVISDVIRNPGILIWTEGNYDTLSAYNITIKNNILSDCRRNTGLHRGAVSIHTNRSDKAFWVDCDVYDNEIYQNGFSYDIFTADSGNGVVYCESENNIFCHTSGKLISGAYISDVNSVNNIGSNLVITE